ncbi:hypothetical protein KIN20_032925 [Parelaphostrongylus tenuis]|uniref:Uncharacterized protein n=1 Tax=Parelaphostrongylus tenuis TaxID=148309 RepID=A0AAD5R7W5_PARTN|nr:hypothetical protein KIN20_032925 [Parelaphostrongylus tenuis]
MPVKKRFDRKLVNPFMSPVYWLLVDDVHHPDRAPAALVDIMRTLIHQFSTRSCGRPNGVLQAERHKPITQSTEVMTLYRTYKEKLDTGATSSWRQIMKQFTDNVSPYNPTRSPNTRRLFLANLMYHIGYSSAEPGDGEVGQ